MLAESPRPIRVMLVGGYRIARIGLEQLVESNKSGMQVVARAVTCAAAVEIAGKSAPDVVVIDPDEALEDAGRVIGALVAGAARVVILTAASDGPIREGFMLQGASGVVQKSESPETLLKAIGKVHQGELWLDRSSVGRLFVALSQPKLAAPLDSHKQKLSTLTPRERQIVARVATDPGAGNRKLAEKLNLGENTLRNHLSRIYDKLGVPNRLQLYVYAERHLLNPPQQ